MKAKIMNDAPERTIALVLDSGDEVMSKLHAFAAEHNLMASRLTAIGAFERATLGYFNWERKAYERIPVDEQVEVLSLLGDVAEADGQPALHIHAVLGRSDGSVVGGHLLEGHVRPTLEVIMIEPPAHLKKRKDPETGLALIVPDES